jgi:hypothetical protein
MVWCESRSSQSEVSTDNDVPETLTSCNREMIFWTPTVEERDKRAPYRRKHSPPMGFFGDLVTIDRPEYASALRYWNSAALKIEGVSLSTGDSYST